MEYAVKPLIEKALAKYYGSYAALEAGHVQLALTRLTGGESEEIYLAHESRGAKKAMLWDNMLAWKRNQFLLGAGTVTADTADHEAQDTGLVFGATYVVYAASLSVSLVSFATTPPAFTWLG